MAQLFGYLLGWDGFIAEKGAVDFSDQFVEVTTGARNFSVNESKSRRVPKRWGVLNFDSPISLSKEDDPGFVLNHYRYEIWYRVNEITGTIIIASDLYKITDAVVSHFNFFNKPNLSRKVMNIQGLCLDIMKKKIDQYLLTYYLADVPGYGSSLRSIALYGDDIAEAGFLEEERQNFSPRQIGVRPSENRYEVGRFGNTGTVQFSEERVALLEGFLSFAKEADLYIS